MNITAKHPTGIGLVFNPDKHEYKLDNGKLLQSVTTIVKRNFPIFDSEGIAKRKAKKDGVSAQSLIDKWEENRIESANFGTKVHLMADTIIKKRDFDAADELALNQREKAFLVAVKTAIMKLGKEYEILSSEEIIFSPSFGVAGTVDLKLRHRKTKEYVIGDWKTSKRLDMAGFNNEMGFGPCSKVPHANFHHYSLQLSTYKNILIKEGYLPLGAQVSGLLISFQDDGNSVKPEYIKTVDYSDISARLLEANKK